MSLFAALLLTTTSAALSEEFFWPGRLSEQRILFAGAHPDDEWGVAPLLADACIDGGAKCHFVVASEAHSYGCVPTIGLRDPKKCTSVRREEMQQSAALFGATLDFFGWEDFFYGFNQSGMEKTIADWGSALGGRSSLVAQWENVLRERRPTIVFTFDPRHGSTCHPGHRAAASLLLEAVERLPVGARPQVWLEQTDNIESRSPEVEAANREVGYVAWPDAGRVHWFDADRKLKNGLTAYDYALTVRRTHASQYPKEASGELKPRAGAGLRRVPLLRYVGPMTSDLCTPLSIDLPTFDIPGNKRRLGLD
jgi:LmbE family N-acetylglucosaminyl deacetylase